MHPDGTPDKTSVVHSGLSCVARRFVVPRVLCMKKLPDVTSLSEEEWYANRATRIGWETTIQTFLAQRHRSLGRATFAPSTIPVTGILTIMKNYDPTNIHPHIYFLDSLKTPAEELEDEDRRYEALPQNAHSAQKDEWLRSLLPTKRGVPMLRSFTTPAVGHLSLLARCIRFAKSHAEEGISWAVHPSHVVLICKYTNKYGIALENFKGEGKQSDLECMQLEDARRLLFRLDA
jgi:hypothetical protein